MGDKDIPAHWMAEGKIQAFGRMNRFRKANQAAPPITTVPKKAIKKTPQFIAKLSSSGTAVVGGAGLRVDVGVAVSVADGEGVSVGSEVA